MTKHFLLVNENGSDNIGDHAINEGLKTLLSEKGDTYESAYFSVKEGIQGNVKIKDKVSILAKLKKAISKFKALYQLYWYLKNRNIINQKLSTKFDAVIIGGGQLILSGGAFPIAMYTWAKYAKNKGIPVFILGVGSGESFSKSEEALYKNAFKHAELITVREKESIEKLNRYFGIEARFSPDLAFGIAPLSNIQKKSGIVVGMTDYAVYQRYKNEVTDNQYDTYDSYLNSWLSRTKALVVDSEEPIYLASTTHKDAACNRDLYQLLKKEVCNPIELVDGVEPLGDYRRLLAKSRVVYSGRMHSLILGKIEGCQLTPWMISAKLVNFMSNYQEKDVFVLKQSLSEVISGI